MANDPVELIRKLALENARLHDVVKKAEKIHHKATGKSLITQLGLDSDLQPTKAHASSPNVVTLPVKPILNEPPGSSIPDSMLSLNNCIAPPLQSNPNNFRLGIHPLTDEQQHSLELAVTGASLKIEAGAGAGKTSGLTAISQNMGRRKGLYLAFNQAIIKEATSKFNKGTSCRTTHSVAFEGAGYMFKHRLQKKTISSQMIIDALLLNDWAGISKWAQANAIRQWVVNYTQSDEAHLTTKSAPWKLINLMTKQGDKQQAYVAAQPIVSHLGPYAVRLWELLRDVKGTLPIWPDVYLKIWALTEPVLACDFILLDEAQDTSGVTLRVINEQPCQVIWVGDRRQQIYAWRGAVNAMDTIETKHTSTLTRSFRYGQPIAEMANKVLHNFLGEKSFKIVGSPMVDSRICVIDNPKAILCRGNRGAMTELMEALKLKKRVHMAGDVSTMINEVEACVSLMEGRRPRLPEFQMFRDWNELVEYSETEVGAELATLVRLILLWPAQHLLSALKAVHNVKQEEADLTISTVHKAKGLEFPTVRLADDFAFPPTDSEKSKIPYSEEEARIFYVGITRAQFELDVSQCRAAHVALNNSALQ
ncbi:MULTISPECIES: 3'-5' exonuclease [Pseudomonas]|uniref:3'-5' exonuclease n=1 Tax=Pseudomonas TaxID=286 RepID=UPI000F03A2FD|nr:MULTISPECIES: 3'-5' exonuclease [Pseudomonas]MBD8681281.1 ATP-dependent helicase [Pseudomonas sp. CFBP 13719]